MCVWGPGTPLFGLWQRDSSSDGIPNGHTKYQGLFRAYHSTVDTIFVTDLCTIDFSQYYSAHPSPTRLRSETPNCDVINALRRTQPFVGCLSPTWLSDWTEYYQSDSVLYFPYGECILFVVLALTTYFIGLSAVHTGAPNMPVSTVWDRRWPLNDPYHTIEHPRLGIAVRGWYGKASVRNTVVTYTFTADSPNICAQSSCLLSVDGGRLLVFEMFKIISRFGACTLCFKVCPFYFSSLHCWEVFL